MGRIEHYLMGNQSGADPDRVHLAKQNYQHLYVEMDPGLTLQYNTSRLASQKINFKILYFLNKFWFLTFVKC